MKLGLLTAAFPDLTLDEVAAWAAANGYEALEIACWPAAGGERRHFFSKLIPGREAHQRGPTRMQPNLKFTRSEFADRLAKTRQAMAARGMRNPAHS